MTEESAAVHPRRAIGLEWRPLVDGQPSKPAAGKRLMEAYKRACYRFLGARFDETPNPALALRLRQAGLSVSPGLYQAMIIVTGAAALVTALGAYALILSGGQPMAEWVPLAVALSGVTGLATMAAFPAVVNTRIGNRASKIERELPFTLSELSVLSSIGLSPVELMRTMARREHDPTMTEEFRHIIQKADMQGKDLVTALAETAKESSSEALRVTFWDLANMMHQGGNLDEYLRSRSDDVMNIKRAGQKDFIDRLAMYADMYVTVVLIGVMFLGVGAFLLDAFGSTAGGLTANALLLLLTYGIIPLIVITLGVILAAAHTKSQ